MSVAVVNQSREKQRETSLALPATMRLTPLEGVELCVVDDRKDFRAQLSRDLKVLGAAVQNSAPENLLSKLAEGSVPQVLIMDLRFDEDHCEASAAGVRDGVDLVRQLAASDLRDIPKIVFLTGSLWGEQLAALANQACVGDVRAFEIVTKDPDTSILSNAILTALASPIDEEQRRGVLLSLDSPVFPGSLLTQEDRATEAEVRTGCRLFHQRYSECLGTLRNECQLEEWQSWKNCSETVTAALEKFLLQDQVSRQRGIKKPVAEILHDLQTTRILVDPECITIPAEEGFLSEQQRELAIQNLDTLATCYRELAGLQEIFKRVTEAQREFSLPEYLKSLTQSEGVIFHDQSESEDLLRIPDQSFPLRRFLSEVVGVLATTTHRRELATEFLLSPAESDLPDSLYSQAVRDLSWKNGYRLLLLGAPEDCGKCWEEVLSPLLFELSAQRRAGSLICDLQELQFDVFDQPFSIYVRAEKLGAEAKEVCLKELLASVEEEPLDIRGSMISVTRTRSDKGDVVQIGSSLKEIKNSAHKKACGVFHDGNFYIATHEENTHVSHAALLGAYLCKQHICENEKALDLALNAGRFEFARGGWNSTDVLAEQMQDVFDLFESFRFEHDSSLLCMPQVQLASNSIAINFRRYCR